MADVAFSDAARGWAAGTACVDSTQTCTLLVDSTTDGGQSWGPPHRIGQFPVSAYGSAYPSLVKIRFIGSNVWVAGPGIYESHDSGATWMQTVYSPIVELEPAGTSAWAMGDCTSADPTVQCVLFTSPIGSNVWSRAAVQPPTAGGTGGPTGVPILERAPNMVDFLVSGSAQDANQTLLVSRDDGGSWTQRALPCTLGVVSLRSPDGTTVWMLCGGGAGSGPKAVYVSHDSGRTWHERAASVTSPPVGTISSAGYASSLAVTLDVGLIGSLRAGVIRSADGGRTWREVGATDTCLTNGNGVNELWFLPSGDGWALEQGADGDPGCPLLVRTTDGGVTWRAAGAPLGWSAIQR